MTKIFYRNIILILFSLIITTSCNSIKNTHWKYREGFHIGDVIILDSNFMLKNDTIYSNKIPVALFVETKLRISDRLLIISNINGELLGSYCSK